MFLPVAIKMQREYPKLKVPVAIVAGTHDRFPEAVMGRCPAAILSSSPENENARPDTP